MQARQALSASHKGGDSRTLRARSQVDGSFTATYRPTVPFKGQEKEKFSTRSHHFRSQQHLVQYSRLPIFSLGVGASQAMPVCHAIAHRPLTTSLYQSWTRGETGRNINTLSLVSRTSCLVPE